jgi:hypothetical protein
MALRNMLIELRLFILETVFLVITSLEEDKEINNTSLMMKM